MLTAFYYGPSNFHHRSSAARRGVLPYTAVKETACLYLEHAWSLDLRASRGSGYGTPLLLSAASSRPKLLHSTILLFPTIWLNCAKFGRRAYPFCSPHSQGGTPRVGNFCRSSSNTPRLIINQQRVRGSPEN